MWDEKPTLNQIYANHKGKEVMGMKRLIIFLTIFMFIFLGFSPNSFAQKKVIPIYTPGAGGTAYILGGGIASILNKYIPEVQMMVEATGGTTPTVKFLGEKFSKKQEAYGISTSDGIYYGYAGQKPFDKPFPMLRGVTFLYGARLYMVVRAKSPINTYYDLKGKRVGVGAAGSGFSEISMKLIEAHGLTTEMYKRLWLGYTEVVEGVKDGSIDAGVLAGAYPLPAYRELSLVKDVRILPADEAVLEKVIKGSPYFYKSIVRVGSYKGIDKDVPILACGIILETHSEADPTLVYNMLKVLFDHKRDLEAIHPSAKEMTFESALFSIAIPLHPGAEKYFKEVGVIKK
jgi:TRAP transporter TAXI family solute receptor